MTSRYPAIPDVGDTVESVAEATRALKLHAEVAQGARQTDEDNRFIKVGELAELLRRLGLSTEQSQLGAGYYKDGSAGQNLSTGWNTIDNDRATVRESLPPGVNTWLTNNTIVGLQDTSVYIFSCQFDCTIGNQDRDFEVRMLGQDTGVAPLWDTRFASRSATVKFHFETAIPMISGFTLDDYQWEIRASAAGTDSISNAVFGIMKVLAQ